MAVSLDKRSGKLRRLAQAQATFRRLAALVAKGGKCGGRPRARLGYPAGGMAGGFVLTGARAEAALAATLLSGAVAHWGVAGAGRTAFVASARRSRRRRRLPAPVAAGNGCGRSPNKCGPNN